MSPNVEIFVRRSVFTWILGPVICLSVLIALPELIGKFIKYEMGNPWFGFGGLMMWIGTLLVPFAAHAVMIASLVGVVSLALHPQFDWKYIVVIVFGLFVSGAVLFRLYFAGF